LSETYDVYFGKTGETLQKISTGQSGLSKSIPIIPLEYGIVYNWRVDAINEAGTTTGDTWSFTTVNIDPPVPTALNCMATTRRLTVISGNKFWYET